MVARPLEETSRLEPGGRKAPKDNVALLHEAGSEWGNFTRLTGQGPDRAGRGGRLPQTGDLEIPSLYPHQTEHGFARTASLDLARRAVELPKGWDKIAKVHDAGDAHLPPDVQKSKEACLKMYADRLGPESEEFRRVRDEVIPKMEKDILSRKVETTGARDRIDMRQELKDSYEALTHLGSSGEAERLTFKDAAGVERHRYSKGDVDNILVDAAVRLSDRKHMNNQGHRNECAGESIARVVETLPGQYCRQLDALCSKGEVELPDGKGGTYLCKPDAASCRVDREGKSIYWTPENKRGAAGVMDVLISQYNLDLVSMKHGGPPGRYLYVQEMNPLGQSNTGEHVYDTRKPGRRGEPGKEIARNPCLTSSRISDVIQGMVGDRIADDFGKRMTLVGERSFGNPRNVTTIRHGDGEQLVKHVKENQAMGWDYAVLGTHTGNYWDGARGLAGSGGKKGGWHATGIYVNNDNTTDMVNNWGNLCRLENQNANKLVSWMEAPHSAPHIDRQRRDHILGPDRRFRHHDPLAADFHHSDKQEKVTSRDNENSKDKDKGDDKYRASDVQRRIEEMRAQLSLFRDRLSALAEDDPRRRDIKALLNDAEVKLTGTMQELPRV